MHNNSQRNVFVKMKGNKMEKWTKQLLNTTSNATCLYVTGGGTGAISELLKYGGGSELLLEAVVPYNQQSFISLVGRIPDSYCSEISAEMLAMSAYKRAKELNKNNYKNPIGVGMTCSLKHENERKGRKHGVYISFKNKVHIKSFSFILNNNYFWKSDKKIRQLQEECASKLLIYCFLNQQHLITHEDFCNLISKLNIKEARSSFAFNLSKTEISYEFQDLINDNKEYKIINNALKDTSSAIFPGSFNPLHACHIEIAKNHFERTGQKVAFEISLSNFDKPNIGLHEALKRYNDIVNSIGNFSFFDSVILTDAPLFIDKIELFKGGSYLVGYDTCKRLLNSLNKDEYSKEIFKNTKLFAFHRTGIDISEIKEISNIIDTTFVDEQHFYDKDAISSTKIRNERK